MSKRKDNRGPHLPGGPKRGPGRHSGERRPAMLASSQRPKELVGQDGNGQHQALVGENKVASDLRYGRASAEVTRPVDRSYETDQSASIVQQHRNEVANSIRSIGWLAKREGWRTRTGLQLGVEIFLAIGALALIASYVFGH